MSASGYRYVIELFREDGSPLGQASVNVDWGPAEECARFEALRRGQLTEGDPGRVSSIEPLWLEDTEPRVEGFRINFETRDGQCVTDFSTRYFKALATQASAHFVERGKLQPGDKIRFLVSAFQQQEEAALSGLQLSTEEIAPAIPIRIRSLQEFLERAERRGQNDGYDIPVFMPTQVLEEAAALTRQIEAKETGGILIGHLHRDHKSGDLFAEITAQIHARHTESELTRLTFTAQTWTEVRMALELRKRDEIMLGWWHSHPVREWCKSCAPERQRVCAMAGDFFSAHDQAMHRTIFPRAYSVALVVNDVQADDVTFSAFGWRNGLIETRGFAVTRAAPPAGAERTNEVLQSTTLGQGAENDKPASARS